ncbi:MAG: hypothetical protein GXY58_05890 [Planctomycetaceae bacterium]|nr:hypothetical protein [Planctomycetaceae bacterium]
MAPELLMRRAIEDACAARGFNELRLPARELLRLGPNCSGWDTVPSRWSTAR